jgi:hypothetical protein
MNKFFLFIVNMQSSRNGRKLQCSALMPLYRYTRCSCCIGEPSLPQQEHNPFLSGTRSHHNHWADMDSCSRGDQPNKVLQLDHVSVLQTQILDRVHWTLRTLLLKGSMECWTQWDQNLMVCKELCLDNFSYVLVDRGVEVRVQARWRVLHIVQINLDLITSCAWITNVLSIVCFVVKVGSDLSQPLRVMLSNI